MREQRALRQTDIPGISARQVSRVEAGVSRLRYAAAQKFAEAFGMETGALLDELGRRAPALRAREQVPSRGQAEPDAEAIIAA
jgi:transcriptional regulator with XRE-family HTH domain